MLGAAERELHENEGYLFQKMRGRHRLVISDKKGEELSELERLYSTTGSFEDLGNLARYLTRTGQWQALLPHSQELLRIHRTVENLNSVVVAMQRSNVSNEDILDVIDSHNDFTTSGFHLWR